MSALRMWGCPRAEIITEEVRTLKRRLNTFFFKWKKKRGEPLEHATKRVANVNNGIYKYDTSSSRIE